MRYSISVGQGANSTACEIKYLTFDELKDTLLKKPTRISDSAKNTQYWFIGGECHGERNNDAVKSRSMLTFDIDKGFNTIDECVIKIPAIVNYMAYSTFSNNIAGKNSYRVIIPLTEPITDKEIYKAVIKHLNTCWFNGNADPASEVWAQIMFYGNMSHMSTFENSYNDKGEPFNWRALDLPKEPTEQRMPIIPESSTLSNQNLLELVKVCTTYIKDDDYQTWISVGMACKHLLGDNGYDIWLNWSMQQATFKDIHECKAKWLSFSDDEKGYGKPYLVNTAFGELILNKDGLSHLNKENKLHTLMLETINCRYVINENKIYDLKSRESLNTSHWNEMLQVSVDTLKKKPTAVLGLLPYFSVSGFKYNPLQQESVFCDNGKQWINEYYDTRVKSNNNQKVIDAINQHVSFIFNGKNETIFKQFLAHNYKHIGKQLGFYLFIADICGGVGKSLIINAVCNAIGLANAKVKTSKDLLKDNFNSDILKSTLVFVDELGMSDKDRRKETDKLKTLTNGLQSARGMHKEATTVKTYYNTLMSANSYDAMLFDDNDRRCAVIETCWTNREEFKKELFTTFGKAPDEYFKWLADEILSDLEGVAAWLESITLADAIIYSHEQVLATEARKRVIENGRSPVNTAIESVLNNLNNPLFVESKEFLESVEEELDEDYSNGKLRSLVSSILKRDFKFIHIFSGNDRIRFDGEKLTFYASATFATKEDARTHIKEHYKKD